GNSLKNRNDPDVFQAVLERTLWMRLLRRSLAPHARRGDYRPGDRDGAIRCTAARARLPIAIRNRYANPCRSCLRRAPPGRGAWRRALPPRIGASRLPVPPARRLRGAGVGTVAPPHLAYARPPSGVDIPLDREPPAQPRAVDGIDRRFAARRRCGPSRLRRR